MMEFIIMTLSFTVAILLASGVSVFIVMQPRVMKWYTKRVTKISYQLVDELYEEEDKDL